MLNECEEYPEIAPGCIICKNNLDKYKQSNKCEICKYGYFKTRNESCVYCRSEKYGGPACYECGYENNITDNIICKDCLINDYIDYNNDQYIEYNDFIINSALSSKGKCYNCYIDLSGSCIKCKFINDTNNNEKLTCTLCKPGYYINSEGKCISYIDKIQKILLL